MDTQYGKEIWKLYQSGNLTIDTEFTGKFESISKKADVKSVMREINDAREEAIRRKFEQD